MNILAVGYYDDFARFFLAIKNELRNQNNKVIFNYFSLYLSGFFYSLIRGHCVSFFSLKVWLYTLLNYKKYKKLANSVTEYKSIQLAAVIIYHVKLDPESEILYKMMALSYIDCIENVLKKQKPNLLILSGDSRMCIEIFKRQANSRNIKTLFFEQGPFGTTILDHKGVNANASIRSSVIKQSNLNEILQEKKIKQFLKRKKYSKYKRIPLFRGSDYLFQILCLPLNLVPIDIKMELIKWKKSSSYKQIKLNSGEKSDTNKILLILQVPYDVNMVHHSPFFEDHYSVVKSVFKNLPSSTILVVREHPLYKGKYEEKLYNYMLQNNIALDALDLNQSIDQANVIVVNNSTVGIEAIAKYKPVVTLGNSYYDLDQLTLKLCQPNLLAEQINKAIKWQPSKKNILNFLEFFCFDFLIDGHYRDQQLLCIDKIVKIINRKLKS